jgi:putative ABC transport system permease protein
MADPSSTLPLFLRFAGREMRSGIRGFGIFLACLALGVAAIAAAGSTAQAFRTGLAAQAREILGGDVKVSVDQRRFTPKERAAFARQGQVVFGVGTRAMAEAVSGERRLVDLRGVSAGYPLTGKVTLRGAASLSQALSPVGGVPGAAVEQALMDRLGLKLGDRVLIGNMPVIVRAVLLSEPDRLSRGFSLGPRVLTRIEAVEAGGFVQDGALFGETARIALPGSRDPKTAMAALDRRFKGAGLELRDRTDSAPGLRRLIDQLEYFLAFIGLASLVAGGLGVAGAVGAYLEARKPSIAVLKALGAEGALIRDTYLVQIAALALLGVGIGLAFGAAAPLVLGQIAKDQLPVPALFAVYPEPLIKAAVFGLLAAAAFSLPPLARARATPPAALFRKDLSGAPGFGLEAVFAVIAALGLAALAVVTAPTPVAAGVMMAGVAAGFASLWGLGLAAAWGAGRLRQLTTGPVRIGLANLAGPRSAARTAAPAIGLGVALLAAVVLIQSSLLNQVRAVAPKTAPAMVFTEIPGDRIAAFDAAVSAIAGPLTAENYLRAPFVTGRIVRIKGQAFDIKSIADNARWAFDNDVALSAMGAEPAGANIKSGQWWGATYAGEPLVAMEQKVADGAGLKLGDSITLSVLGREIDVRIAVLRQVDWGGFGPTFALIVNPKAVEGAVLRNVAIAKVTKAQDLALTRALGRDFPAVNVISVREQLEAAGDLFDRLALAVRGAAGVAALAGLLVLFGAVAAGARARAKEAAILKVLGASRGQILVAYGVEYGAVGLIAGAAGVALGAAAAWPVVVKVFEAVWTIDWREAATLILVAAGLSAVTGLGAAMVALSRRPAPVLRDDS